MKKQEFVQIKGLDIKELKAKVVALKDEIAKLTMEKNRKILKDLKSIFKKRKDLAQVLTVLKQKELLGQLESRVKNQESSEEVKSQNNTPSTKVGPKVKGISKKEKVKKGKEKSSP